MKKWGIVIIAVMISGSVFAALDSNPAPFRTDPTGTAPTTYQSWDFATDANPTAPDVDLNPYGTAELTVLGDFWDNTIHYDGYAGRTGVWGYENDIQVFLPNNPVLNPYKEIWVQITYTATNAPNLFVLPEGDPGSYAVMTMEQNVDLLDGWFHATYRVIVEPNPAWEINVIRPADCTLYVDDLIIETICDDPDPATMLLLGLGGLLLRKKK